jgi:DNA invertase Pin-like site-specific DNA recombinase
MNAYTYARYSTDKQTEESIVDQQRRCHEFAKARGWRVASDFTDEGISGAALGNRPGLQAALNALKSGDVFLVADLTRVFRSVDLAPLVERLKFRGVRVVGVFDGFDSDNAHARMQASLSGLMSDELRAGIRARTHSALELRAKTGRATGGKTYGYDSKGAVVEAEAAIVREIFARVGAGEAMRTVANDLNARGVASPGAKWNRKARRGDGVWLVSALNAMLQNERYIGRVVWNRSEWVKDPDSGKRARRERPSSEWTVGECPAIVDGATWDSVAVRMKERATGRASGVRRYLLSGLLVCEECGATMVVRGHAGSHYGCSTFQHGGAAGCDVSAYIRRDAVEATVLGPVRRLLLAPEAVELACATIRELVLEERTRVAEADDPRLAAQIAELEALLASSTTLVDTLRAALEDLRAKQAAAKRAAWRKAQAAKVGAVPAEGIYRDAVAGMLATLEGDNVEAARATLRKLVGTVPVFVKDGEPFARVGVDPAPLLEAAGIEWIGSGGRI